MKLNWTKIAVYVTIIGVGLLIAIETRNPPTPPLPPVVILAPHRTENPPPAVGQPPVVPPSVVVEQPPIVVQPPPAVEPPKVVRRPPPAKPKALPPDPGRPVITRCRTQGGSRLCTVTPTKFAPKPASHSPDCSDVPAAAYQHPSDVVLAAAKRMGVPADKLAVLKRCIGA